MPNADRQRVHRRARVRTSCHAQIARARAERKGDMETTSEIVCAWFFSDWDRLIDSKNCPQQVDPSIREALWNSTIALDTLGSGWGASGVRRSPAFTAAGWTDDLPGRIQAATLVIRGALDDQA